MKLRQPHHAAPGDAAARRAARPVVAYRPDTLPPVDLAGLRARKARLTQRRSVVAAPRDAACIEVPAGAVFRIVCTGGPQVGDLNLWNARDLTERFYAGKTRALHGTHLSTGDRLWSSFPHLRPMATIIADSLDWYGFDADGASVHDVIGTRCDPYTARLLGGADYHQCCHSNLTRALAAARALDLDVAEGLVHDVLNVFMCTGFTADTHQYFMKASPVRPGDFLEFVAGIDLLVGLSACPGGDCSAEHSSDAAACHPLVIEVDTLPEGAEDDWQPPEPVPYDRSHGT
ncbi:DUF1989 domain-containing protein [Rhodovulum sp. 12E13]|uniref:urea carboxylase-associated family protein n=1 Tax=Rhodovulum sp. 12E13 TaxID=2203891 RepID=UPI000E19F85E|nr:DUF1989 domain-containing protein [Rhodovulum sp. 12E13]RDC74547.1 DUF1989 domain-containing protein [Rhodovulum sp. 12E13]